MTQLITIDEVAEYLQIPVATLYQWRHKGTGPKALKLGRHLRHRPDELVGPVSHAVRSDAVVFGEPAFAPGTLAKGQLIRITGRLDQREWTADDDTRRQTQQIVSERVDLVGAPVRPAAPGNSR